MEWSVWIYCWLISNTIVCIKSGYCFCHLLFCRNNPLRHIFDYGLLACLWVCRDHKHPLLINRCSMQASEGYWSHVDRVRTTIWFFHWWACSLVWSRRLVWVVWQPVTKHSSTVTPCWPVRTSTRQRNLWSTAGCPRDSWTPSCNMSPSR